MPPYSMRRIRLSDAFPGSMRSCAGRGCSPASGAWTPRRGRRQAKQRRSIACAGHIRRSRTTHSCGITSNRGCAREGTMSTPYEMPATRDDFRVIVRWARIILTLVLIPLSWHAFHDEYGSIPLLGDIDTAVHEFGHMLFMPFGIPFLGHTMVILGGSLTQVVFPLIFMAYFLRDHENSRRDLHAALL